MAKYRLIRALISQPDDKNIRYIPLTRGQFAIVDASDYEELNKTNWYAAWCKNTKSFYVHRPNTERKVGSISMHRRLLGLEYGDKRNGDHINGNTLDNRRSNLRIATPHQNSGNSKLRSDNTSGYRGVYPHNRDKGKWCVAQQITGRTSKHQGVFSSKEDAAQVYILIAYLNFGEFSSLGRDYKCALFGGK